MTAPFYFPGVEADYDPPDPPHSNPPTPLRRKFAEKAEREVMEMQKQFLLENNEQENTDERFTQDTNHNG